MSIIRRNQIRAISVASIALILGATIAGCAGRSNVAGTENESSVASATPSAPSETPTTDPSAAETSTPEPTATAVNDRCDDLLDSATLEAFKSRGFVNRSDVYNKSLAEDYSFKSNESSLARFLPLGGFVCAWGPAEEAGGDLYAYGPITAEQAEKEKDILIAGGAKKVEDDSFERYTDPYGYAGGYAFLDGYWAASLGWDNDGDYLDEVVHNAAS